MGVSLWDMFFDSDYRQRRDINALGESTGSELDALRRENRDLHEEVHELTITVMALMKELGLRGVIAPDEIRKSVDIRLGRAFDTDTETDAAVRPMPALGEFTCRGCNQVLPSTEARMTSKGMRCATCASIG